MASPPKHAPRNQADPGYSCPLVSFGKPLPYNIPEYRNQNHTMQL